MSNINTIVIHKNEILLYGLIFAILFSLPSFPLTRGDDAAQGIFDELKSCMSKTTDVKKYENGALGINILYPSGWNVTGPIKNPLYSVVNFKSPCSSVVSIVVETLGRANVTLKEYARAAIDKLNSPGLFQNITENNAILAGNPAQKLDYFMKQSDSVFILPRLISQFFTIKDGKAYIITYNRVLPFDDAPASYMIKSLKLSTADVTA